jgi:arylsulfatase
MTKIPESQPIEFPSLPLQEDLPFPPTPSASVAGRTMQESVYQRRVEPQRLPDGAQTSW